MAAKKSTRAHLARSALTHKSSRRSEAAPQPPSRRPGASIEAQRRRLLNADAVVICIQRALDSRLGPPDELRVVDALQVASEIINDVVAELEQRKRR